MARTRIKTSSKDTPTKKAAPKKAAPKKAAPKKKEEEKTMLGDIISGIKIKGVDAATQKRSVKIITKTNRLENAPYRIDFQNKALQLITGGIIGGTFCEIAATSQGGKSFLLYELMAQCQRMGGFVNLNDGERAFESSYGDMVGLDMNSGSMAYTTLADINQIFAFWVQFIKGVRAKKKKAPILLGQDSFPTLQTSMSLKNIGVGEALGYEAMQRNQAFSREMEKFIGILDEYDATMIMVNQFTKNNQAGLYEDPYHSLCEEKMQYYATQRLKGKLSGKLVKETMINGNKMKIPTGMKTTWTTIKNRAVKPFQKATVKIRYAGGIDEYAGLVQLFLNTELLKVGTTSKDLETGKKIDKAIHVLKFHSRFAEDLMVEFNKKTIDVMYKDDLIMLLEKQPTLLEPIWTGTYDDGTDEVEENLYTDDDKNENKH